MKKEYNQTPKSIVFSLLTLANKLKQNQTNNILNNNSLNPLALANLVGLGSPNVRSTSNPLSNEVTIIGDSFPHTLLGVGGSKFNAKTEAINYSNNKVTLDNSKFLNKNKTYPTSNFPLVGGVVSSDSFFKLSPYGEGKGEEQKKNIKENLFFYPKIENLDLVNLNTKVDLTNFSFNKKIVFNNKDIISLPLTIPLLKQGIDISPIKGGSKSLGFPHQRWGKGEKKNNLSIFNSVGNILSKKKNITLYKYISHITKSNNIINTNPNLSKKYGLLLKYNRDIGYNFLNKINSCLPPKVIPSKSNHLSPFGEGWESIPNLTVGDSNNIGLKNINLIKEYKEETYKLLFYFFKSIYCLISKPTILFSPDKITIRLFYYLMIPKRKVFNFFSIHYNKEFRNKWNEKKLNKNQINKRKKRLSDFKKVDNIFNLNIHSNDKSNKFNFNKNVNLNPKNIRLPIMKFKLRKAISRLKSKPALIKKIYFYLIKFNLVKVFHNKFLVITNILSKLFNKPVILDITRIHNFKFDTNILANAIQLVMKNKKKNPKLAINKIYKKKNIKILNDPNLISKNNIISFLSGLNIYINGRIMREPIIPRITTKKYEKGATATGKVNYLDTSFITNKNRKGAYTIKVKAAQNFF